MTTSAAPWPTRVPWPMRPDLDPPGGQVLGHVERDLGRAVLVGRQRADPEGGVGELGAHGRLDQRRRAAPAGRQPACDSSPWPSPSAAAPCIGAASGHRGHCAPAAIGAIAALAAAAASPKPCRRRRHRRVRACRHPPLVATSPPISSATVPPKTPRSAMPIAFGRNEVAEPAVRGSISRLRVVLPPPLPEELLDLRHVRAAGDVLDGLVVDRHHRRADERLAGRGRSA